MWKSPGAKVAAAGLALTVMLSAPLRADTGAEAFARKDYASAAALWQGEAARGQAEAQFGLGLIHDLGLGVPRNSAMALRWYLEAAGQGLPDAEFNVAVMLDAGTGIKRDVSAAALWYARAAASGHARASYNLGLLYEAGAGVPLNPDLARVWFTEAETQLPAATERLAALLPSEPKERGNNAPEGLSGNLTGSPDAPLAELVWTARPGPEGSTFEVELARLRPDSSPEIIASRRLGTSAVRLPLPDTDGPYSWRVAILMPDGTHIVSTPWEALGSSAHAPTAERVTIYVNPGDAPAQALARDLAKSFGTAGIEVVLRESSTPASQTTVAYRYDEDAPLAAAVAAFLPALSEADAKPRADLDARRGEVAVWLVGGSAP